MTLRFLITSLKIFMKEKMLVNEFMSHIYSYRYDFGQEEQINEGQILGSYTNQLSNQIEHCELSVNVIFLISDHCVS